MSRHPSDPPTTPRRPARTQLVVILVIALASVGGAYLLFGLAGDGGPWGTTNRGTFVDPPVTAAELEMRDGEGGPMPGGVWWLWVVPKDDCGTQCREALHQLRQLHVLLNRDAPRVRRGLVTADGRAPPDVTADYPRMTVLSGNLAELTRGIYVVDPLGNLVFHYPLSDAGEPVLDDLKRLLKVSQIG